MKKYARHKKPKRLRKQEPAVKPHGRMTEYQVNGLGSIFPGFDTWYRANYDEQGRHVGEKMPTLHHPIW